MTQQPDAVQTASSLTKQFGVHITAKVSEQNDGLHVKNLARRTSCE